MEDTWLHQLLGQFEIPEIHYNAIYDCLVSKATDTVEKCEQLEELVSFLESSKAEKFVRQALELLEKKSVESLLDPASHSQDIKTKKKPKSVPKDQATYPISPSTNADLKYPVASSPGNARIDSSTENAILEHLKELKVQDSATDLNSDPYENEVDVYSSLSPTALLQMLFSNMTPEQVENVLEQHHYSLEDTMDSLFNSDETNSQSKKKPRQVCRHFLLGQCYRSDCWYSHDPDAVLCKFWLKGRCYKGDQCEFSHGQGLENLAFPKQPQAEPVKLPPSMEDFPALGGSSAPTPTKKKPIDIWAPSASYNDTVKKAPTPQSAQQQKMEMAFKQNQAQSKQVKLKGETEWVTTGNTLSNSYFQYREEAIGAALERNRLFQQYVILNLITLGRLRPILLATKQRLEHCHWLLINSTPRCLIYIPRLQKIFLSRGIAM
jgi:hypothetical protein